MSKKIAVLGSTGSIGVQTLEVASHLGLEISALSANKNVALMLDQIRKFRPGLICMADERSAREVKDAISGKFPNIQVLTGQDGNIQVASCSEADLTVAAMVGVEGLAPVIAAIQSGHDIALANKETLVAGGSFVIDAAKKNKVKIYPVDSEHSAVWQCLPDDYEGLIKTIYLTASGGPFRGYTRKMLEKVTSEQALAHPTWKMGKKITIDSATLMNKGLEVIEAHWLFSVPAKDITAVIHPQSLIHSMVEFIDGSVIAQLGSADMRIPIQLALTGKKRTEGAYRKFDPFTCGKLEFDTPQIDVFKCLRLAYDAIEIGSSMPAVMNSANEMAVSLFLSGEIGFLDIADLIERTMEKHLKEGLVKKMDCDIVHELDNWARRETERIIRKK